MHQRRYSFKGIIGRPYGTPVLVGFTTRGFTPGYYRFTPCGVIGGMDLGRVGAADQGKGTRDQGLCYSE